MESRHCIILHQIFARLIRGLNRGRSQFIMAMNCVLRERVSRLVWKKSKYFCVESTICFGPGKPRGSLPLGSLVAVLEACRTMRRQCNLVQIRKTHPVQAIHPCKVKSMRKARCLSGQISSTFWHQFPEFRSPNSDQPTVLPNLRPQSGRDKSRTQRSHCCRSGSRLDFGSQQKF